MKKIKENPNLASNIQRTIVGIKITILKLIIYLKKLKNIENLIIEPRHSK